MSRRKRRCVQTILLPATLVLAAMLGAAVASAQDIVFTDPATLAFEESRWADAIEEYREILAASPEDRVALIRIAQSQAELGRHEEALNTLESAEVIYPEMAMINLERARNQVALGQIDNAFESLLDADHKGLRSYSFLQDSADFDPIRNDARFVEIMGRLRDRVRPCQTSPEARQFDFWLGRWEVRTPDGTLAGYSTVTKEQSGCAVVELWEAAGGGTGRSTSYYLASRDQWRHVWVGSGSTFIEMSGALADGQMRMEGTIEYPHLDRVVAFRSTWSEGTDGRVRQRMEEFRLASGTWVVWFDGIYRRVDE